MPSITEETDTDLIFISRIDEYMDVYEMYQKQQASIWVPNEIDYSGDKAVFENMNENEQHFFKNILCFFASADALVSENISSSFIDAFKPQVVKACYAFQNYIEMIHAEVYSLLLTTMIPDKKEQNRLFDTVRNFPVIQKKMDYGKKWITCDCSLAHKLLGYIIFEGIFFSGSFCAIYWNKTKGGAKCLQGLCTANEFIARDEGMHVEFGITLYKKLDVRLGEKEVHRMFDNAVNIEKEFIVDSLPCSLIGMNSQSMSEYIEYISDYYLAWLGYSKLYNTKNPFSFMDAISLESKSNFFETRVSQYAKAEVEHVFKCDDDDF